MEFYVSTIGLGLDEGDQVLPTLKYLRFSNWSHWTTSSIVRLPVPMGLKEIVDAIVVSC